MGPGFHFSKEEKGEPEDLEDIRASAAYGGTDDDYERRKESAVCAPTFQHSGLAIKRLKT